MNRTFPVVSSAANGGVADRGEMGGTEPHVAVAEILTADAEKVTLETTAAAPPGATLKLRVREREVGVKVRACRRTPAGRFRIEGRWVGLSREQRDAVLGSDPEP